MAEAWSPFKGAVKWLGSVLGWNKLGLAYKRRDLRTDTKIHKVAAGLYAKPPDVTPAGASAFSASVDELSTAVRTKYVSKERVLRWWNSASMDRFKNGFKVRVLNGVYNVASYVAQPSSLI